MKQNIILVDCKTDTHWEYKEGIEEITKEKWFVKEFVTNKLHGNLLREIKRYIYYFFFSFKIFLQRNNYSKIIAWQQFYGLILVFYCRLFRVKKFPQIYIMSFMYKPKRGKLYKRFIKYIIESKYIKKLIILSDSEKDYYANVFSVNKDLFYCTRIGIKDVSSNVKLDDGEKYYLSVGRSNRDYKFLRDIWNVEYGKLIVINDSYEEEEKEGIIVLKNCYGDEYLNLLANCYAQIIPLYDENVASGSLSFLQAMMLSKPTIVTNNNTVKDYIKNYYNGIIIDKKRKSLEEAIEYLSNTENYISISTNARKEYEQRYSESILGRDIGKMIIEENR